MKGVPIKFRTKDGIICELPRKCNDTDFSQLVGYDIDGNEIYEDDVLVDENGVEYRLNAVIMFHSSALHFNLSPATVKTHNLKLKGN